MVNETYYQRTEQVQLPLQSVPHEVDVAVIGGGFAGLHTGLSLQERGIENVAILEQQEIGFGASGRNGGFVFAGFSLGEQSLLDQLGPELGKAWYQRSVRGVNRIRELIRDHQMDCEAIDQGVLWCNWFRDPAVLRSRQKLLEKALDTDWQWMEGDELRGLLKSTRYSAALFERNALHLHPRKFARELAKRIQAQRGTICEQSSVTNIVKQGAGFTLQVRQQDQVSTLRAREVVMACGGYLQGELAANLPQLRRALMPIATYVMCTEPLGARLQDVIRTQAAVYDTRFAFDYYRALADTRILWGGRIHIRDADAKLVSKLLYRDILKVYPQLEGINIEYAWSGLMSYARHQMPQVGQLDNGIWYAQAFGGHGLAPTAAIGEVLASAIAEGDPSYRELQRFGLSSTFGAAGLAAVQCEYWRLQALDAWNDWRGK